MTTNEVPTTYEEWFHCITVKCKLSLSRTFAKERIGSLTDTTASDTKKFIGLYGDTHRLRVIDWFRRAASE